MTKLHLLIVSQLICLKKDNKLDLLFDMFKFVIVPILKISLSLFCFIYSQIFRNYNYIIKGPPGEPSLVTVDSIQYNSARLSWIRGYHGGAPQTFVIQTSKDLVTWRNVSVYGGLVESTERIYYVLQGEPATTYYVQMYSFNSEGSSHLTTRQQFTTLQQTGKDEFLYVYIVEKNTEIFYM